MGTIFKFLFIYLFIYGCVGSSSLCEGPLQLWQAGATPHRGVRASHGRGLSCWSTGSRRAGSAIVAHGPSRSVACGIPPDQGSNPCPLHWQADSQPLRHQGSPQRLLRRCFLPSSKNIHDVILGPRCPLGCDLEGLEQGYT